MAKRVEWSGAEEGRAGGKSLTTQRWNNPLDCEMTRSSEVGHYLFKAAVGNADGRKCLCVKRGLMFNSFRARGAVIPRVCCLFPNPTTPLLPFPFLSSPPPPAPAAPTFWQHDRARTGGTILRLCTALHSAC